MEKYIGLDVHAASTTFAVLGESGKRLTSHVVETNGQALVEQLKMIPGSKHVCLEEGTQSAWVYEILSPQDFGMTRYISIAHRLTGWNAIKSRAEQLGLPIPDEEIKRITGHIKELADRRALTLDDVDSVLREWGDDHPGGASV